MAPEAALSLANLVAWSVGIAWLAHLTRTAGRPGAATLGVIGHYRPALTLVGLVLVIAGWRLGVQEQEAPASTRVLLAMALAGQAAALVAVDRWHRLEERQARGRAELYSDRRGCYLILGVAGLTALSVVPALVVVVRLLLSRF
jgi:hypothetical protein